MIVMTLTDCPPQIRGDLSRWLFELSGGVYVGNVSARVRDALWARVCDHLKNGRATMVYTVNNEQRMDFRVHNAHWEPIDFDGLKLMLRPNDERVAMRNDNKRIGSSNAARFAKARAVSAARLKPPSDYVAIDVETTGLSASEHEIIELAAVRVRDGEATDTYHALVQPKNSVPPEITQLTGITSDMLMREGHPLMTALEGFLAFVDGDPTVAHNAAFDYGFLRSACQMCSLPPFSNRSIDTLAMAKRKLPDADSYKLIALAKHLHLDASGAHRSLQDCFLTVALYEKLIKM